jgi:CheY-like chemotaxis protein
MCPSATARLVLVVEDEPLVRSTAVFEFERRGWNVVHCPSAEAALDLIDGRAVDVLFTDIQLSGVMTGWDLAESLRKDFPSLAVVYASGNAADRTRRVAGSSFFDKPYDTETVVKTCEDMLNGRRDDQWLPAGT